MNRGRTVPIAALTDLVRSKSKHSEYQLLHPTLAALLPESIYQPAGKSELQRHAYMSQCLPLTGLRVLDIGANTGFFSLAAIEAGAHQVVSQEGNCRHAEFVSLGVRCLSLEGRVEVRPSYFDFSAVSISKERFDLVLCLNVLHHMGDDFGDPALSMDAAKHEMIDALNRLADCTEYCWLQLGFNWKGNPHRPLFANGTKSEVINFVEQGVKACWDINRVGVFDPSSRAYLDTNGSNMKRFDSLGEFLNRPLFLLRSRRTGS